MDACGRTSAPSRRSTKPSPPSTRPNEQGEKRSSAFANRNALLEHRVQVGRRFGNALQNVPVLDDLAVVIETKDIDAGPIAVSWPLLIAVQDDELTIGQHPAKPDALTR